MTAIVLALIIAVSGGTAFAAEGSLPGDALYPVKLGVNENIRSILAFSDEAEAELAVDLADRRLKEGEQLTVRGRSDAELLAQVEARFEEQEERARARIERLEAQGNLEAAARIASNLETVLEVHEAVLARLSGEAEADAEAEAEADARLDAEARARIISILEKVRLRSQTAAEASARIEARVTADSGEGEAETEADAEARVDVRTAAEGRIKAAENKIAEVEAFIDRIEADAEAEARAQAQLETAVETLAEAEAALEAESFNEAFLLAGNAHRLAQQAKLILQTNQELDIEVNLRERLEALERRRQEIRSRLESNVRTDVDAEAEAEVEADTSTSTDARTRLRQRLESELGL